MSIDARYNGRKQSIKSAFDELVDDIEDFVVDISNDLHDEVHQGIIQDTPVDTGRAQKGWHKESEINKIGDAAETKNEVPYVVYLEEGHSMQAPRGFIRININKAINKRNGR